MSYQPYRDIETGFYKMLSNVFVAVTRLKSQTGDDAAQRNKLDYVITPQLTTESSSPSLLTWPPTQFTVNMTATIADASGKRVADTKVRGEGKAEFDEFKKDVSLSAKRASEDALLKMQKACSIRPNSGNSRS